MKNRKGNVLCLSLALFIVAQGCEKQSSSQESISCNVSLGSPMGGRIEISRSDPDPMVYSFERYGIFWHLPNSSSAIDFIVGYGGNLEDIHKPLGARASFIPPNGAKLTEYTAEAVIDGRGVLQFNNSDFNIGHDQGDLLINNQTPSGLAILNAIENKISFKLTLHNDGEVFARGTIDPSPIADRDFVYAEAKRLVESGDPRYCRSRP